MVANQTVVQSTATDQVESAPSSLRGSLPSTVVVGSYLLLGLVAFWPAFKGFSQQYFATQPDYDLALWYLAWMPHALGHGLNPFLSNAIFAPHGVNLSANAAAPLLGIATTPLAWLSPIAKANLLMVLAMPVSATAAFVVLRKWQVWLPAAALGGLIYGFSPYMVGQSLAHISLSFVPLPPFIALTVASIVERRGSPRRLGVQLGLLVIAQYLISPEVLVAVMICVVVALACITIRRRNVSQLIRTLVVPVGVSLLLAAVVLAYPVWMLLAGPQHFTGATRGTEEIYYNDLLNSVVPGPMQKVSMGMGSTGARLLSGDIVETGGYIGVPLLILTCYLSWRSRRSPRTQLSLILSLVAVVLGLGPHLAVDGRLSQIPLPFLMLDHLPLLDNLLPARMALEVGAFLAALIAFGLDDMHRDPASIAEPGRRRSAILAAVTLAVLVVTWLPQWPYVRSQATTMPAVVARAVPPGDPVVLTYPIPTVFGMQAMMWQAEDDFKFRLLGGYSYHPTSRGAPTPYPSLMRPSQVQQFLTASGGFPLYGFATPVSPQLVASTRTFLSRYHVRMVLVDRSVGTSTPVMELFNDALGHPKISVGNFAVWAEWHGIPKHQVFPDLITSVLRPANGATLSGASLLDATATDYLRVIKVVFLLTDTTHHADMIAVAHLTPFGWVARWDTNSIPSGTYSLQSLAYDSGGRTAYSPSIKIIARNQ
jgi:Bacterial Ig domain